MIQVDFTQADVDGAAKDVLDSLAEGGIYSVVFRHQRIGGSGLVKLRLEWVNAFGDAQFTEVTVSADTQLEALPPITVQHPSTITAELDHYTESGSFTVPVQFYIARVKEEG